MDAGNAASSIAGGCHKCAVATAQEERHMDLFVIFTGQKTAGL